MKPALGVLVACSLLAGLAPACRAPSVTPRPEPRTSVADVAAQPGPTRGAPALPLHPLLADPRLARAREAATDHDWPAAARAFVEAVAALVPDPRTPAERCAWAYGSARLLLAAGQPREAAQAFDAARAVPADGGAPCPLAASATYHAADAYLKAGDLNLAIERASAVDAGSTLRDDADLVLASALAAEGRAAEAVPRWRSALGHNPKLWIDVALPLSSALLDGAEGAGDDRVTEAMQLATRVIVEAPRIAESSGAEALRDRAIAKLAVHSPATPRELTVAQRAQQAKVWLDSGEAAKAAGLCTALVNDPRVIQDPALYCSVSIARAQALGRTKAGSGTAWDEAIARCEHDPSLVTALYSGAKAAAGKQPEVARARYARVEERFHDHRLADDARFQAALLVLGGGDEAAFTRMMLSLPDDYPAGDQGTEALFRVALLRMTHGDWAGACAPLDRIVQLSPDDQHWATAGRAEYFRARAAEELGQRDDARARYARVLERHPFAYYMTQAYARLSEDDPSLATRTLAAAFAREDSSPFLASAHAEIESAAWGRARALLEVGDVDLARRELSVAGAARDDVDPEVTWSVALLYDQAGAPELGHALARQKVRDYLAHYPVGAWRTKWEIAYPRAFAELVAQSSAGARIPPALTWAIMREESDFVADARSGSNAFGLMQIILPTARTVARGTGLPSDEASLRDPRVSIALGTRLLGQLRGSFASNPTLAIAAYNAGGGAVGRWLAARGDVRFDLWVEQIPWDETRGYEKRVLSSEAAYAYLYDPAALDEVLRISTRAAGRARATGE
jgi:soluble lytic murein transglycosylase